MGQGTFSDLEYGLRKRKTKREAFLRMMDELIDWAEWVSFIEPFYPKGERGRPPQGIEKMLRMLLLQAWFSLSDEGVEEAIYDSYAFRMFMKINFIDEQAPDATTLLKFRHLLEKHGIYKKIFDSVNTFLEQNGYLMRGGTIVDASLINAASSTKNKEKARDPEMHSTKKGKQWYFGMKVHIGVDAMNGYVHSLESTSANVHDITMAHKLIRKDDEVLYGDSGYIGLEKREEIVNNEQISVVDYYITRRPSSVKTVFDRCIEKSKSSVRAKVEHPFLIVKRFFGYDKAAYKGIAKNAARFHMLFASANLLLYGRQKALS